MHPQSFVLATKSFIEAVEGLNIELSTKERAALE